MKPLRLTALYPMRGPLIFDPLEAPKRRSNRHGRRDYLVNNIITDLSDSVKQKVKRKMDFCNFIVTVAEGGGHDRYLMSIDEQKCRNGRLKASLLGGSL